MARKLGTTTDRGLRAALAEVLRRVDAVGIRFAILRDPQAYGLTRTPSGALLDSTGARVYSTAFVREAQAAAERRAAPVEAGEPVTVSAQQLAAALDNVGRITEASDVLRGGTTHYVIGPSGEYEAAS
jgi:hypothetical protein